MNIEVADSARLIGKLRLGDSVRVAQGAVLRSIGDSITVGNSTMVLENSVLIGMPSHPLKVGSKTVFGHKCLVMGAEVGDLCEIGNNVMFLPGSKIGDMCIFGEGTIVPEGAVIDDGSVVVGRPARVIRKLTEGDKKMIARMRGNDTSITVFVENIVEEQPKEGKKMGKLNSLGGKFPVVAGSAFIYDTAEINGDVVIGENTVIGSGVRIIGDSHGPVRIGNNVQVLENSVLHLLPDNELIVGDDVTIGPGCMIHGTKIGANSVIESGSIVCDYTQLGENTWVKSGTLVKQRSVFEDNQVLEGFPAKVTGENSARLHRPDWAL